MRFFSKTSYGREISIIGENFINWEVYNCKKYVFKGNAVVGNPKSKLYTK